VPFVTDTGYIAYRDIYIVVRTLYVHARDPREREQDAAFWEEGHK